MQSNAYNFCFLIYGSIMMAVYFFFPRSLIYNNHTFQIPDTNILYVNKAVFGDLKCYMKSHQEEKKERITEYINNLSKTSTS